MAPLAPCSKSSIQAETIAWHESDAFDAGDFLNSRTESDQRTIPICSTRVFKGTYRCTVPLIRPSKLTSRELGGVGKELSEGWSLNFAVGCTHGCPFCYVDSIHKRFGVHRYGKAVLRPWGDYLLIPENLNEAIEKTSWERWKGKEVMLSSTHDPYLPEFGGKTRIILEKALQAGVRFCIQTRSPLVSRDLDLLAEFKRQVRLQVSIATFDRHFAQKIEPRVPSPERRLKVLLDAKSRGIRTGVIVAPVFPPNAMRSDVERDLSNIVERLAEISPDFIFGESLHVRGDNLRALRKVLLEEIDTGNGFDREAELAFRKSLGRNGLNGTWWSEC